MKLKLIHRIGDVRYTRYYDNPVDLETDYFLLSRERYKPTPSSIRIPEQLGGLVPGAYYILDDTDAELYRRELNISRLNLWTTRPSDYTPPLPTQVRAVGRVIVSQWPESDRPSQNRVISETAGISERAWRYYCTSSDDRRRVPFDRWQILKQLAGLSVALPVAKDIYRTFEHVYTPHGCAEHI